MLALPISNREGERVFSQVTVIKEKKRNGMKTNLLESILYYKFGLRRLDTRVQDFKPPNSLCSYNRGSTKLTKQRENDPSHVTRILNALTLIYVILLLFTPYPCYFQI